MTDPTSSNKSSLDFLLHHKPVLPVCAWISDKLREWIKNYPPSANFFSGLTTLNFKQQFGYSNLLNTEHLDCLLRRLQGLEMLGLDQCDVTDNDLTKVQETLPNLRGFSASYEVELEPRKLSLQKLNAVLKSYRSLTEVSLDLSSLTISEPSGVLEGLTSLRSLRLMTNNEALILKALKDNPMLENLDLQSNKLSPNIVLAIAQLKNLHTLNIAATGLNVAQILKIAQDLPLLKALTIQCKTGEEDQQLVNQLAIREMDVTVIQRKR